MEHLEDGRLGSLERQSSGASAPDSTRSEHGTLLATAVFNIDELVAGFFDPEAPEDEENLDLGEMSKPESGSVMSEESRWGFRTGSIEAVGEVCNQYREFLRANG